MNIAVTGARGRLGSYLVKRHGVIPLECDISDKEEVTDELSQVNPDVIINCASYNYVDKVEHARKEYNKAIAVNERGVDILRTQFEGRIIHLSTDYIFNGRRGPYGERRRPDPVNNYGWTKWGGEIVFLTPHHPGDVLVRTTGLYGPQHEKGDFVSLIRQVLGEGKQLKVTKELKGNQTYVPHLAEALMKLIEIETPPAIVHIASRGVVSRYDFALMVASVFGLDKELLVPVRTSEIDGWIAPRPTRGGLKTRLARKLGLPIYKIIEGLEELEREN